MYLALDELFEFDEFLGGAWLSDFLVQRPQVDVALGVAHCNLSSVRVPLEAVECRALRRLAHGYRALGVPVKVPDLQETISVATGKDGWVHWAPLNIVDVLLGILKCEKGKGLSVTYLRTPKFDSPIYR